MPSNNSKQKIREYFDRVGYAQFYSKYFMSELKSEDGHTYRTKCPFGDHDNDTSFVVDNTTGKYTCNLCGKTGGYIHFYAKLNNLNDRKDFYKVLNSICNDFGIEYDTTKDKIAETYDYVDKNGDLVYQTVRMEPKRFAQRHMNEGGLWEWNLKGIELMLYNLPKVIEAQQIIIVEGEKDVDNLEAIGIGDFGMAATTCPLGTKSWKDSFNDYLKDKLVILMPDNDVAGREHMVDISKRLSGVKLKWVDLPGLSNKQDATDYINKFKDKTEAVIKLNDVVNKSDFYNPIQTYSVQDVILEMNDFTSIEIPDPDYYLNPWLTNDSITLIAGDRNVGKSWLGLGIAEAITKGKDLGPWECECATTCLYVDGEMPPSYFNTMYSKISDENERQKPLYIYSDHYASTKDVPRCNLFNANVRDNLKTMCKTLRVKVMVLDNLASLAPGADENVKKDWDVINQWLLELRFAGVSTIMLHHTNKEGKQRGTSAREDNIDNSILMRFPGDYSAEDGIRFKMFFTKNRAMRDHNLLAEQEVSLDKSDLDHFEWVFSNAKQGLQDIVLQYLNDGFNQTEIADMTFKTKGYISQVVKKLREDGLISK